MWRDSDEANRHFLELFVVKVPEEGTDRVASHIGHGLCSWKIPRNKQDMK
jgi:hypothetical protein